MNVAIFGAGRRGLEAQEMLMNFSVKVDCFVDNDVSKQDTVVNNIPVKSLEATKNEGIKYFYIIGSQIYLSEIRNDLINAGINLNMIASFDEYILDFLCHDNKYTKYIKEHEVCNHRETVILDLYNCQAFGGRESLIYLFSNKIEERGINCKIIHSVPKDLLPEYVQDKIISINLEKEGMEQNAKERSLKHEYVEIAYIEKLNQLLEIILNNLPATILINSMGICAVAAILVKRMLPDKIKTVFMIHGENNSLLLYNKLFGNDFDAIACVSESIRSKLINSGVKNGKVFHKRTPVNFENFEKPYNYDKVNISIGAVSRIEKEVKRCDLLIDLTKELEKLNVKYELNVVGDGKYLPQLKDDFNKLRWNNKVKFHGFLPSKEISIFWHKCDIFVSLSESEGLSVSMLEAMAGGATCIVTNVNDEIKRVIKDGETGYIVECGDVKLMAEYISNIYKNRSLLKYIGDNAKRLIDEECDIDAYMEYLCNILKR